MLEGDSGELRATDSETVLDDSLLALGVNVEALVHDWVHTVDRLNGHSRGTSIDVGTGKSEPCGHGGSNGLDVGVSAGCLRSDERVVEAGESVASIRASGEGVFRVLGRQEESSTVTYFRCVGDSGPMGAEAHDGRVSSVAVHSNDRSHVEATSVACW